MKREKPLTKPDTDLTHQVGNVIRKVIMAERKKLHMKKPQGIKVDIKRIIENEIEAS